MCAPLQTTAASCAQHTAQLLFDTAQFDIKAEGRILRDDAADACLAVRHRWRHDKLSFVAYTHACKAFVPTLYDLTDTCIATSLAML
jgi:hypothetical protein